MRIPTGAATPPHPAGNQAHQHEPSGENSSGAATPKRYFGRSPAVSEADPPHRSSACCANPVAGVWSGDQVAAVADQARGDGDQLVA